MKYILCREFHICGLKHRHHITLQYISLHSTVQYSTVQSPPLQVQLPILRAHRGGRVAFGAAHRVKVALR